MNNAQKPALREIPMRALAFSSAVLFLFACTSGEGAGHLSESQELREEDCALLMDKIHEVFGQGLSGDDLDRYEADRDREADVAECVEEQNWNQDGLDCVLKATSQAALQRCVFRN